MSSSRTRVPAASGPTQFAHPTPGWSYPGTAPGPAEARHDAASPPAAPVTQPAALELGPDGVPYIRKPDGRRNGLVETTTGPGGGIEFPGRYTGLMLPATLRQQPHRQWPTERPAYDGPITLIGWSAPPSWAGHYDTYINVSRLAPPLYSDFGGYAAGAAPADWSLGWHQGALLEVIETAGAAGGQELRFRESADPALQRNAAFWNACPLDAANVEVLMDVRDSVGDTSAMGPGVLLRADPTVTGANGRGYGVFFRGGASSNAIRMMNYNVSATELGVQTFTPKLGGAPSLMRVRVNGTTISAKIWDRSLSEPVDWMITRTDATHEYGAVGIISNNKNIDCKINRFAVAFDGETASFT